MNCLVTGGAGFIGSNLVRALLARGDTVRVLDNFSTGRQENVRDLGKHIEMVKGDLRDPRAVNKAVKGVKGVFHLAALPSVERSVIDPVTADQVNVLGALNLLVAARDAGVERFVFSSSSSVYGDTPTLPKRESMRPAPLSPYAVQKLACEHYCRIFHGLYGLRTCALRYFNVFGPRQNPRSQYAAVIPAFIQSIHEGRAPVINGDGGQTRDFTYVDDVVSANILAARAPREADGGVFNIARGKRVSINEITHTLVRIIGANIEPVHGPRRKGDIRHSQADPARAMKVLGWKPRVDLDTGLRRTVEWFIK